MIPTNGLERLNNHTLAGQPLRTAPLEAEAIPVQRGEVQVQFLDGAELWSVRGWNQAWRMYRKARTFWRLLVPPPLEPLRVRYRRSLRRVPPDAVMPIAPAEVWATNLEAQPIELQLLIVESSLDDDRCESLAEELRRRDLEPFARSLLTTPEPYSLPIPETDGCERSVRTAREYIDEHFATRLNLNEIAAVAERSKFHLARGFGERVGVSIWEYVQLVRLDQAMVRLRAGARPLEVACETAFADQAHLTRTFREIYGITPARYARG